MKYRLYWWLTGVPADRPGGPWGTRTPSLGGSARNQEILWRELGKQGQQAPMPIPEKPVGLVCRDCAHYPGGRSSRRICPIVKRAVFADRPVSGDFGCRHFQPEPKDSGETTHAN